MDGWANLYLHTYDKVLIFCMKYIIFLLALTITSPALSADFNSEMNQWRISNVQANEKCLASINPAEVQPDQVTKISDCITSFYNKSMAGYIVYPDLYKRMRQAAHKNALKYESGKIDRNTYFVLGQENWGRYQHKVKKRLHDE